MIQALIPGIIQGAIYGLLALGLVLVYKGARVFNFAQAEFGTVATFFAWYLIERHHFPYLVGVLVALILIAMLGFGVERLVIRPLQDSPRVTMLVATAGVALLAIQFELIQTGVNFQSLHAPITGLGPKIFGVFVSPQQILIFLVLGALGVGMAYFFSRTDLGLAVLATSQEPVATELVGIGANRMSSFIWTSAAVLGGIAGILVAPTIAFTPGFMTTRYLLPSFTAAVVGGITSLPGAFVGGILIGVTQALGQYFDQHVLAANNIVIPGVPVLLVFILLVVVLIVRPRGLLGTEA